MNVLVFRHGMSVFILEPCEYRGESLLWLSIISKARADDSLEKALGPSSALPMGVLRGPVFWFPGVNEPTKGSVVLVTAAHVLEETSEVDMPADAAHRVG